MNKEHRVVQFFLKGWPFPRGAGRLADRFFNKLAFEQEIATVRTSDGFEIDVPPNDAVGRHIYLTGEFDRSIVEVLLSFSTSGDALLDIGANLGYVSACFLKNTSKSTVIAVEPQPYIGALLRHNLSQFKERQRVFPVALSDHDGEAWFYVDPLNKGKSRLVARDFEGAQRIETISSGRFINSLALKKLDLLKIDVEGHEATILNAAQEQLASLQPKIVIFEGNQGALGPDGGPVGLILQKIGYKIYGIRKRLLTLSLEPVSCSGRNMYNDYVAVSQQRPMPPSAIRKYNL